MLTTLLFLLLACGGDESTAPDKPPAPRPIPSGQAWEIARAGLLDGTHCYHENPRYCLDNPVILDPHIQAVLDERYDGVIPNRRRDLADVIRRGQTSYKSDQFSAAHVHDVEQKLRGYYDNPEVKGDDDKGISVHLGVPPGKLRVVADGRSTRLQLNSPLIVDDAVLTTELARQFKKVMVAHPDVPIIQLRYSIPQGTEPPRRLDYRFTTERRRVLLRIKGADGQVWRSPPIQNWSAYLTHKKSLAPSALEHCHETDEGLRLTCDPKPVATPKPRPTVTKPKSSTPAE